MKNIEFTKMVATGNDFILVDGRDGKTAKKINDYTRFARVVCLRKRSVGADGLLLIENSKKADIAMRIFNPDGSEVAMCGNGSRCVAYYAAKKGITRKTLSIDTKAGILKAEVENDVARIGMTQPIILKKKFELEVCDQNIEVAYINTGVPHVIHFVEDLDAVDVRTLGKAIRFHREFAPEGTNVDFIKVRDRHTILMRTYERGVEDETFACGTGAVASAVIAAEHDYVESPVKIKTWGKEALYVYFKKIKNGYKEVFLEGEVKLVYSGVIEA